MTVSSIKGAATSVALIGAVAFPATPMAQTRGTGGIQLTFGLALRLEGQDNRALAPNSAGNSLETTADLSFGLLTETRSSRLSFDASGSLRNLDIPTGRPQNGFVKPSFALSYDKDSAASHLSLNASLSETHLTDNDTLTDDGIQVVTSGSPIRRSARLEGAIDWGVNTPLGYGILARVEDTTYRGGTATGLDGTQLNDSLRTTLEFTTRLDLSKSTELRTKLAFSEFDEAGTPSSRDTVSLSNRLTLERPIGAITVDLNVVETEEGTRVETALGRTLEMPLGALSGQIGAARSTGGDLFVTGRFDYSRPFPRGALNVGLSRDVASDNDQDSERVSTRLSFAYLQELTKVSAIQFSANWAEFEETGTGLQSTTAGVGATYSHELTRDWDLSVGYRHDYRKSDATANTARSNTLFVEMRRVFIGSF